MTPEIRKLIEMAKLRLEADLYLQDYYGLKRSALIEAADQFLAEALKLDDAVDNAETHGQVGTINDPYGRPEPSDPLHTKPLYSPTYPTLRQSH